MSTKESNTDDWGDKPIPEDAAIKAAHPIRTKRHDLYEEAQRMVGAKRGKFALVELVNWLLYRIAELEAAAQGRPMATAPRNGTWILILNRGPVSPEASAIRSKGDGWEGCDGWEYSDQELGIGHPECTTRWLPIPALPKRRVGRSRKRAEGGA